MLHNEKGAHNMLEYNSISSINVSTPIDQVTNSKLAL